MSKFVKIISNKWFQGASLIINILVTVHCVISYNNLDEVDPNFALRRSIFLMGMIVFGLSSILQVIAFLLKKKGRSKPSSKD